MNDERDSAAGDDLPISRDERLAEEAVRELPTPVADAAFRDRLRAGFATGTLAPAPGAAVTTGAGAPGSGAARRPGFPRRGRWIALAATAAAALLVVVLLRTGRPAAEAWTIVSVTAVDSATIRVDGREVTLADVRAGHALLRGGARIELPESTALELRRANVLALETAAGTRFSIPTAARGGSRLLVGRIEEGEVRFVTGPAFVGRGLRVDSDEASVEITGTTFSVIRDSLGTCVCVEEGVARLTPRRSEDGWNVPAGRRLQYYVDGRPAEELDLRPGEAMKLRMLRDRARPELERTEP